MATQILCKILFTVSFPPDHGCSYHVTLFQLRSLASNQLADMEVIETIDHLFDCPRCLDTYRFIRASHVQKHLS